MKTISEIKKQQSAKVDQLIKDSGMFFAFNNEQFEEGKTPLEPGDKYIHIGHGCILPKSKLQFYIDGMAEIGNWYKAAVSSNKARKANILYELNNHEAFYTYDIEEALMALGSDYTSAEVWAVFRKNINKYQEI